MYPTFAQKNCVWNCEMNINTDKYIVFKEMISDMLCSKIITHFKVIDQWYTSLIYFLLVVVLQKDAFGSSMLHRPSYWLRLPKAQWLAASYLHWWCNSLPVCLQILEPWKKPYDSYDSGTKGKILKPSKMRLLDSIGRFLIQRQAKPWYLLMLVNSLIWMKNSQLTKAPSSPVQAFIAAPQAMPAGTTCSSSSYHQKSFSQPFRRCNYIVSSYALASSARSRNPARVLMRYPRRSRGTSLLSWTPKPIWAFIRDIAKRTAKACSHSLPLLQANMVQFKPESPSWAGWQTLREWKHRFSDHKTLLAWPFIHFRIFFVVSHQSNWLHQEHRTCGRAHVAHVASGHCLPTSWWGLCSLDHP